MVIGNIVIFRTEYVCTAVWRIAAMRTRFKSQKVKFVLVDLTKPKNATTKDDFFTDIFLPENLGGQG